MPNLRVGYQNRYTASATVLTASSSALALPVGSTKNADRSAVWRSVSNTVAQTIDADFGAAHSVSMVALANVKVIGTGAVEVYQRGSGGSPGTATLVATLPAQNAESRMTVVFFASQTFRHWQLRWTNPTAATDYAELGFAFLGTYWEPALNVLPGWPVDRPDASVASMSLGGQKTFATRQKVFTGQFRWDALSNSDFATLRAIYDAGGIAAPVVLSLDAANAPWTTWLARVRDGLPMAPSLARQRHGVGFAWEEVA